MRNNLCRPKENCLGPTSGPTVPCNAKRCGTCKIMSKKSTINLKSGKKIKASRCNCLTRNVIYYTECKLCGLPYVGKTTQPLASRINGHRSKYYECLKDNQIKFKIEKEDDNLLGLHIYNNHGSRKKSNFNETYKFTILAQCNPKSLDISEHKWIQKLKTITPYGLNSHDRFGMNLL